MSTRRVLLLGESKTGKTHLAGQVYGRIRAGKSVFSFRAQPRSLKLLEEVMDSLTNGRSAAHTPAGQYGEIEFDLTDDRGDHLALVWPDYAGEQVTDIVARRSLSPEWARRIEHADRLMLLVRPTESVTRKSALFSEPTTGETDGGRRRSDRMPAQMRMVELLQIVEHARSSVGKSLPDLDVLLTCADELDVIENPAAALSKHMPMLGAFIASHWGADTVRHWAISALGRPLREDATDEEFADAGPEEQGWVIGPDGSRSDDITRPFDQPSRNG